MLSIFPQARPDNVPQTMKLSIQYEIAPPVAVEIKHHVEKLPPISDEPAWHINAVFHIASKTR